MSLLEKIKKLCKLKGITVGSLGIELGFGKTIYKWDKSMPSADKLQKVATFFEVNVEYLLGLTDQLKDDVGTDRNFINALERCLSITLDILEKSLGSDHPDVIKLKLLNDHPDTLFSERNAFFQELLKKHKSILPIHSFDFPIDYDLDSEVVFSRYARFNRDTGKMIESKSDFVLAADIPKVFQDSNVLNLEEERDIANDLEKMLSDLANDKDIAFQGEPMDEDEREMLRISIENSLRLAKQMTKRRFNNDER